MGHGDNEDGLGGGGGGGMEITVVKEERWIIVMWGVGLVGMSKAVSVGAKCALQQKNYNDEAEHRDDDRKEKTDHNLIDVVDKNEGQNDTENDYD